jgi:hypothetical protein
MMQQINIFWYFIILILPLYQYAMEDSRLSVAERFSTEQDPFSQAEEFFKRSQYNDAITLYEQLFQKVKATEEQECRAHINYGESCLAVGDLLKGFSERDYRLKQQSLEKQWDGSNPKNKRILICHEGGIGDVFFFAPWICALKNLGANTTFLVRKFLKPLLNRSPFLSPVIAEDDEYTYDCDVYLMSLPRYVAKDGLKPTTLKSLPVMQEPYIIADPKVIDYWKDKFSKENLTITLCWRASKMPAGVVRYLERDIPLNGLIAALPEEAKLFSVQGDHRPITEREYLELRSDNKLGVLDEMDVIPDEYVSRISQVKDIHGPFEDTAAVINLSDVFVGCDTCFPNLAGAMRKPVLILLPYESDWRWGDDRSQNSPWMPTMHLLWQKQQGDWKPVLEKLKEKIAEFKKDRQKNREEKSLDRDRNCIML